MNLEDAFITFIAGVFVFLSALFFAMIFVYTPVMLYAEAECLRQGYPKAQVSVGLERYCTTLDGAVTVKVDKQ